MFSRDSAYPAVVERAVTRNAVAQAKRKVLKVATQIDGRAVSIRSHRKRQFSKSSSPGHRDPGSLSATLSIT